MISFIKKHTETPTLKPLNCTYFYWTSCIRVANPNASIGRYLFYISMDSTHNDWSDFSNNITFICHSWSWHYPISSHQPSQSVLGCIPCKTLSVAITIYLKWVLCSWSTFSLWSRSTLSTCLLLLLLLLLNI